MEHGDDFVMRHTSPKRKRGKALSSLACVRVGVNASRVQHRILLVAISLLLQQPCRAAWETSGDWKIAGEDSLSVRRSDGAMAWNPAMTPGRSWSVPADIHVRKAAAALIGSAKLVFGDIRRNPQS